MELEFERLQQLAPDLAEELGRRALVLERIASVSPVGRRALASELNLPEREIRRISACLREAGCIALDAAGMSLRPEAAACLEFAHGLRLMLGDRPALGQSLCGLLPVERVIVVPGDCDQDAHVLELVGQACAKALRERLAAGDILALTGGGTIAAVARNLMPGSAKEVLVLPARGGIGRAVEIQANTLAAEMARKLGGRHRLLHMPDQLADAAREALLAMPEFQETLALLSQASVLLHGIGRAEDMARHRRLSSQQTQDLCQKGAVAEALGCFFDIQGRAIHEVSNIGLGHGELAKIPSLIAVAAGGRKAQAIIGAMRFARHGLLVTDEGAARRIVALLGSADT